MAHIVRSTLTRHTLHVSRIAHEDLPDVVRNSEHTAHYTKFYVVRNFDATGVAFMYLGKGHAEAPREIVAWYRNGQFWSSFGTTFQSAIEGAQRDGWMYAR